MSHDSKKQPLSKSSGADHDQFTPMKRVHKINDLLDRLPAAQRSSLMQRLEGTAPESPNFKSIFEIQSGLVRQKGIFFR